MRDEFSKMVEQIEKERAEKVSMFLKFLDLLEDPVLAPYVALWRSGQQPQRLKEAPGKPPKLSPGFRGGNGIQKKITTLSLPNEFTGADVLKALEEANFVFTSKDPKGAVRDALFSLSRGKKAQFKIAHKVGGGQPNVYQRIQY
jgi:hypothetical protein